MAVTPARVINLKGPCFPQSFLPASLPGAWEQLVMVQLMGTCSCQEFQPFSPWTWLGPGLVLCGASVGLLIRPRGCCSRPKERTPAFRLQVSMGLRLSLSGSQSTWSASPDSAFRIFVVFLALLVPPEGHDLFCLLRFPWGTEVYQFLLSLAGKPSIWSFHSQPAGLRVQTSSKYYCAPTTCPVGWDALTQLQASFCLLPSTCRL